MKTLGLLGGMSWESTVTYYRLINEGVKRELGGLHSAKLLLHSVDFAEIEACQSAGDWDRAADILGDAALGLPEGGADYIVICTNTMHKVSPQIESRLSVPLIHIADATAGALRRAGVRRAALLGTKYTMTQEFYRGRLAEHGLEVMVPEPNDMELVNRVIFYELCLGVISPRSRDGYMRIIDGLASRGAEAVILGCTEIGMLVGSADSPIPVFDTTVIHAEKAVELALADEPGKRQKVDRAGELW